MTSNKQPLSGKARVAGLRGWPVSHSRSPRLHAYWLAEHGIDGAYVPLPVAPPNLATAVRGLAAAGLAGVNVTNPHKQAAPALRSEEHTSELQSLMRSSDDVFCLKKPQQPVT